MNKKNLVLCIAICGIVGLIWIYVSRGPEPLSPEEKKQAIEHILGRSIKEETTLPKGNITYQGKFFSLSYPAYAAIDEKNDSNIAQNKRILEHLIFASHAPKFRFVVMVEDAKDIPTIEELSGVTMRMQNSQYKKTPVSIDGSEGISFVKTTGGIEYSSFFLQDRRSYSFTITGIDAKELETIYGAIMDSISFHPQTP